MKVALKFLLSLALALLVAWAIRTFAFTVFSVPAGGLAPNLKEGNRVIVNRIGCDQFERGELVVFSDSASCEAGQRHICERLALRGKACFLGRIENLPGDTIRLGGNRYVIPTICCHRCGCKDCRYYLVRTSRGVVLVHKHQMVGKAYKLF